MDLRPVLFLIGWIVTGTGVAMIPPMFIDLADANPDWEVFAQTSALTVFIGIMLLVTNRIRAVHLNTRQAVLATVASWLSVALFGALPLWNAGQGLDFADAFFESISGLTTTGSTVISGLDIAAPGLLLWRGLLQWIGGIGIIVMGLAILPFINVGGMQLFRLESSERTERGIPRLRRFTVGVAIAYVGLTALCAFALRGAGMTGFEAVVHAMTTISTGGFSTSDGSVGHFAQPAIHWIITVFMLLGALPFVIYVRAMNRMPPDSRHTRQAANLVKFLVLVVLLIAAWLHFVDGTAPIEALRLSAFNVTSIVTTTGFTTADYTQWGTLPIGAFLILTFVGGCSGSTAGGIKIFRFEIVFLSLKLYTRSLVHPHSVQLPRYGGRTLPMEITTGSLLYVAVFVLTTALVAIALEGLGLDLVTAMSAAATAVANVGPGLGTIIGPAGNFAGLPDAAKWILGFAMLLGRLEFFAVLLLLTPTFWRG